ncbi:MAG TPA: alanine--glyoxylate aminotransferase family protein [Bacteroidota bacterium]|nr:alanine--glyoxylate aminotransferase family protein [Bacteroidota bacterium]
MKKRLFTPGPTPVPETVMLKMAEPIIHHRNPEFGEVLTRVHQNLQYLFQTQQPVVVLTSSGTGGVEASFVSLFSPGDTIITCNGGKFGERWVKMPKAYGMNVVELKIEWGKAATVAQVTEALKAHPEAKAVYVVHSETSTGTAADVKAIAKAIHENSNALVCVDGITAVGAHEMRFDEWGIDVCVTGSQKGLMIPPGLAFVALSKRAIEKMETSTLPKFYFDLKRAVKSWGANDTPWTPAVSLVIGVDAALSMLKAEGIENIWKRHERLANAIRCGVTALGLKLFSDSASFAVTPVWLPEGVEWKQFNKILKSKYGITIAGGQDDYAGKIFRISHLGYYDEFDMVTMMTALELTLKECGYAFETGAGVQAVIKSFQ